MSELKKRGVEVNIGSCGCCDSPWVKVAIDGKVVYDEQRSSIYMLPTDDNDAT